MVTSGIDVNILHGHIRGMMNSHKLPIATHDPGCKSHHLFKGVVLEVLNKVLDVSKVCQVNVLVARRA